MSTESNEDYVLVHKSKVGISRARKFIMGTMAVGAVAAIAGAGTFASFSASTTNDATFQTGLVRLSNTVNSGTTCFSSTGSLDVNDGTCDNFFDVAFGPGSTQTVNVTIKNEGTAPGSLKLFGTGTGTGSACTGAANTAGFDGVQTVVSTGATTDTFQLTFSGQQTVAIDWNATAAQVDTALENLSNIGANDVVVTRTGSGPYTYRIRFVGSLAKQAVAKLTSAVSGTNTAVVSVTQGGVAANALAGTNSDDLCTLVKMTIQETASDFSTTVACKFGAPAVGNDCPAVASTTTFMDDIDKFETATIDLGTGFEPGASKYYKVSFVLPHNAPNSVAGCSGSDQFGDNGVGCDNPAMNGNAALGLRWQLQV